MESGSGWDACVIGGRGDLTGVQTAVGTSLFAEWYGWAAFHPDTTIYEGVVAGA